MTAVGFGHGKVILLGEHAVVYGCPALVGALDVGVEIEARRSLGSVAPLLEGVTAICNFTWVDSEIELEGEYTASAREVLRSKDFEQMSAEEERQAREAIEQSGLSFEGELAATSGVVLGTAGGGVGGSGGIAGSGGTAGQAGQGRKIDPKGRDPIRVKGDAELAVPAAIDVRRRDTGDLLDPGLDDFLHEVLIAGDVAIVSRKGADREPRDRRAEASPSGIDNRLVHVGGVAWHPVQPIHDLDQRALEACVNAEVKGDGGIAPAGGGLDLLDPG